MKKSAKLFDNSSSDSESGKGFSEMFPVMLLNILYSFLVSFVFYCDFINGVYLLVVLCCSCTVLLYRLSIGAIAYTFSTPSLFYAFIS